LTSDVSAGTPGQPVLSRTEPPAKPEPTGRKKIKVPDVVGKDHQLAQDTMQGAGLYSLREEDATGVALRPQLDDRFSESPGGHSCSEDQTITLKAKKDGE